MVNLSKTMNKPMISHDKHFCLCSDIGNDTTCLHLVTEFHKEIIDKIEIIRAISIGSRVNELNKINEVLSIVDDKIRQVLNHTGNKSCVNHTR